MDCVRPLDRAATSTAAPPKARRRSRRRRPKVFVERRGSVAVLGLPPGNRWDAADLVRIRDRGTRLLAEAERRIGVEITGVEALPSGFFAQLHNWHDRGAEVFLYHPEPNVRRMLWFRSFMKSCSPAVWRLAPPTAGGRDKAYVVARQPALPRPAAPPVPVAVPRELTAPASAAPRKPR